MGSDRRATRQKLGGTDRPTKVTRKRRSREELPDPSDQRTSTRVSDPKRVKRSSTKSVTSVDSAGSSRYTDLGRIEKERRSEWDKLRSSRAAGNIHPRAQITPTGKRVVAGVPGSPELPPKMKIREATRSYRVLQSQRPQLVTRPSAPAITVPLSPENDTEQQRSPPGRENPDCLDVVDSATPIASQEEVNREDSPAAASGKANMDEMDDFEAPLKSLNQGRSPKPRPRRRFILSPAASDAVDKEFEAETPEPPVSRDAEYSLQRNNNTALGQLSDMQAVSTSNAVLRSFMAQLEDAVKVKIDELQSSLFTELRNFRDDLGTLSKDVRDVRALISTAPGSSTASKMNTPWAIFEKKLEDATPHALWIFDERTMSRVLSSNVPMTIFLTAVEKEGEQVAQYAAIGIRTLLFGLQPNQGRSAFKKGVGKRHSLFRHAILRNAIYNAQINSFNKFKPMKHTQDGQDDSTSQASRDLDENQNLQSNGSANQIMQPSWLQPDFILDSDARKAQSILETTSRETENGEAPGSGNAVKPNRLIPKEVPSDRDIAIFGAQKIYRIATSCLHKGRRLARDAFFRALGYVMVPWGPHTNSVDQQSLRVYRRFPDPPHTQCDVRSIAQTSRKEQVDGVSCEDFNMNIYRSLVKEHPEMILAIRHDVFVTSTDGARTKKGVVRQICRLVNLIDVAMEFCIEYTLIGGERLSPMRARQQYLQGHPDAMRSIYCVALVLNDILESFLDNCTYEGSLINASRIDLSKVKCGSLDVSTLIPGDSQIKRILNSSCVRMSAQAFTDENAESDSGDLNDRGDTQDGADSTIKPSNQSGVFAL